MTTEQRRQIFLSYAREDHEAMVLVREALTAAGFTTWTDGHLVAGSPGWAAQIEAAIDRADAVAAVLTPAAKASPWVHNEIHYAVEQEVPILPVLVEGTAKSSVPITLIGYQRVDLDPEDSPTRLAATLRHAIDALTRPHRPAAAPPPPPPPPPAPPPPPPPPPATPVLVPATPRLAVPPGMAPVHGPRTGGFRQAEVVNVLRGLLGMARGWAGDLHRWRRRPGRQPSRRPGRRVGRRVQESFGAAGQVLPAGIESARTDVVGRRYLAFLLDFLLFMVIAALPASQLELHRYDRPAAERTCPASPGDGFAGCDDPVDDPNDVSTVLFVTLWIGLPQGCQMIWRRTPGQSLLGLRVVDAAGRPAGRQALLVRSVAAVADLPFLGAVMAVTANHRRLADVVAETFVVADRPRGG